MIFDCIRLSPYHVYLYSLINSVLSACPIFYYQFYYQAIRYHLLPGLIDKFIIANGTIKLFYISFGVIIVSYALLTDSDVVENAYIMNVCDPTY